MWPWRREGINLFPTSPPCIHRPRSIDRGYGWCETRRCRGRRKVAGGRWSLENPRATKAAFFSFSVLSQPLSQSSFPARPSCHCLDKASFIFVVFLEASGFSFGSLSPQRYLLQACLCACRQSGSCPSMLPVTLCAIHPLQRSATVTTS